MSIPVNTHSERSAGSAGLRSAIQKNPNDTHPTLPLPLSAYGGSVWWGSAPLGFDPALGRETAFHQREGFRNLLAALAASTDLFLHDRKGSARIVDLIQPMIEFYNLGLHLFSHYLPLVCRVVTEPDRS